ncbi:MAG: hypothetical protein ACLPN1_14840, partial [Dissulfurispiraceae bacterium]
NQGHPLKTTQVPRLALCTSRLIAAHVATPECPEDAPDFNQGRMSLLLWSIFSSLLFIPGLFCIKRMLLSTNER